MEVTEAPSVHRVTELVCQFYQQFIYKAFIPKQLSRICTLHLRRSLCRRHLRNIAFTSVPSVTPCAYYIRVLVYHSIFRKNRINLLLSFFFLSFCLFYHSVFICLFVILSLFVLLSSSVLLYCKDNSNIEIQKGINYLSINALLVCKKRPVSPLLTPFLSPIKHLFCIVFVTD